MANSIIQVQNISKSYYRDTLEIPVLRNLTLDVHEGEFFALMGPSGSGKTTLLNLIAGIDRPTKGTLIVNGTDIARLNESALAKWRAANVGFVFQFYNLLPVLTAFENVELPLLLSKLSRKERKEHVEFALKIVGLSIPAMRFRSVVLPEPEGPMSPRNSPSGISNEILFKTGISRESLQ